jgi:5'-nucleotidase
MKLLVTNDDGISAEGLAVLHEAAKSFGEPFVVAPATHQSGCSHTVTTGRGVRIEPRGDHRLAVHGTPADCVRVGLLKVVPDAKWVLSGINLGGNLGADVHYSGTVAAVREAVLHGWPGIAMSHYRKKDTEYDWPRVAKWTVRVLRELLATPLDAGSFWNVNFPHLRSDEPDPELVYCPLDPHPLPLSYRHEEGLHYYDGDYHARERKPGCDVDVCFGGRISVTKVRLL